jgi:hypothetical protein
MQIKTNNQQLLKPKIDRLLKLITALPLKHKIPIVYKNKSYSYN